MATYTNGSVISDFKSQFRRIEENAGGISESISNLADAHLELLDEEISIQKERSVNVITFLGAGAVAAVVGAIFCSLAAVYFLSEQVENITISGGFAIVGIVWLLAVPVFIAFGIKAFKKVSLIPTATLSSLQESIKCLRN